MLQNVAISMSHNLRCEIIIKAFESKNIDYNNYLINEIKFPTTKDENGIFIHVENYNWYGRNNNLENLIKEVITSNEKEGRLVVIDIPDDEIDIGSYDKVVNIKTNSKIEIE